MNRGRLWCLMLSAALSCWGLPGCESKSAPRGANRTSAATNPSGGSDAAAKTSGAAAERPHASATGPAPTAEAVTGATAGTLAEHTAASHEPAGKVANGRPATDIQLATTPLSKEAFPVNLSTPLIARKDVFGNPDKAAARISPDGSQLSYLAPVDGVLNVFVAPIDNLAAARPVTNDRKRGIRSYFWAYTSQQILYTQDQDGDENWHVYSVNLASNEVKDLTPREKVAARIEEVSPKFPEEVLIGLNDRDPQFHDIHRVNIVTGESRLVQENPDFAGFVTDDDFQIRFAQKMLPDGGVQIFRAQPGQQWVEFDKIPYEDSLTTQMAGFDKTGQQLYWIDSRHRDTGALRVLDLATGESRLVAENSRADLGEVLIHPTEKTIQAAAFNYERNEWTIVDPAIQPDMDYLRSVRDGEIQVTSRTLDDRKWIVAYLLSDGPLSYYLYDRDTRRAHFLFTNRQALENLPLVKMHSRVIPTRDGLQMVCYLSLPKDWDAAETGRPSRPLPLVLLVHGGPWARDSYGFNPYHQVLANRGYAVLSVNYRGSTGFGKNFVNAGSLEWAGKMHDDLLDAVAWAEQQGIADPAKVAIFGGSYGGYATLVGLTFTPERFACGVDIVGPSNLLTLLKSIPPYWAPALNMFRTRVGDLMTDEGRKLLEERSPLNYVERIQRPLLIAQGKNDQRVKEAEATQIVEAMVAKKIPVTYALFPDEGHGFARPENSLAFFAVAEAFLAQHLGGRSEPIGDAFSGSSIVVPNGAEGVPGLAASLARQPPQSSQPAQSPQPDQPAAPAAR